MDYFASCHRDARGDAKRLRRSTALTCGLAHVKPTPAKQEGRKPAPEKGGVGRPLSTRGIIAGALR